MYNYNMNKPLLTGQQRKNVAREILRKSDAKRSDEPVAFFMAGLPGSGKTEQTKGLLEQIQEKPLIIDMDEIAKLIEGYSPEKAYLFRLDATAILEKVFEQAKKQKYWFIMDGTFSGEKSVSNIIRCNEKGYKIQLLYIHQRPVIAWDYTKKRELVERRTIEKKGFIEAYFQTISNIREVQKLSYVNINVIIKNDDNKAVEYLGNVKDIDKIIGPLVSLEQLKRDIMI
jgi:predicted ABC-type ATPase